MQLWWDPRRRRWLLWGILAVSFLFVNIYRLSTAVLAEELMAVFRASGTELGILHAAFFLVYAIMQLPTGILVDRVGPRWTAGVGAVVMNIGAIWFGSASGFGGALAARFLIGLGGSVIFVSMLRFCANWYTADGFPTMNGLSFAVGGLGGILATTPFAVLVEWLGWRSSLLTLGIGGIIVGVAILTFVRDSADDAGFTEMSELEPTSTLSLAEAWHGTVRVLRDSWTWVVIVLMFCATGINLTLFGLWGIPYVVQVYDTSVRFASLFTLLGGVGAVIGPPTLGILAARTGRRTDIVLAGGVFYTLCLSVLAIVGDPPLVVVGGVYFMVGVLLGAFVLTYPIIKDRHPSRMSGIALGAVNGAGFLGASLLPAVMGNVLDAYWTGETVAGARVYTETGYRIAFAIVSVTAAVTIVCALWLRMRSATAAEEDVVVFDRLP